MSKKILVSETTFQMLVKRVEEYKSIIDKLNTQIKTYNKFAVKVNSANK